MLKTAYLVAMIGFDTAENEFESLPKGSQMRTIVRNVRSIQQTGHGRPPRGGRARGAAGPRPKMRFRIEVCHPKWRTDELFVTFWRDFRQNFSEISQNFQNFWKFSSREDCEICRSRQELSNEYLIAKIGVDTAENGPSKVWDRNLTRFDEKSSSGWRIEFVAT